MQYINQHAYAHIPYPHPDGIYTDEAPTVSLCGCGLCCLCMVVNSMTKYTITPEDAVQLSIEAGANTTRGTRMRIFLDYASPKFDLICTQTKDSEALKAHLRNGGTAIIRAAGDTELGVGLFSHIPHSIVALPWDGGDVCILDPDYREGKFEEEGRNGRVRVSPEGLYCSIEDLLNDSRNGTAPYALFTPA